MARRQSKTECIMTYLLNLIEQGQLPADGRLPTEKMLCEQFGVSRVPVQAAFTELAKVVNIQRTPGDGSFVVPDETVKTAAPIDNLIPFVLAEENYGARFWEAVKGADAYLKQHEHYLMVRYAQKTLQSEIDVIRSLRESGLNSLLLLSRSKTPESAVFYNRMIGEGCNLVFVDSMYRGIFGDLVSSDNTMGGYLATTHLLNNGYVRPAFLSLQKAFYGSIEDRIIGYRMAMEENGLSWEQQRVIYLKDLAMDGADSLNAYCESFVRRLLHTDERPDALVCENDYMALTMYRYLQKYDLRIPRDMAVVGYDNMPEMGNMDTPITSVEQPFYDIGYQAARLCLRKKQHALNGCEHILIPVHLCERSSSAPREASSVSDEADI